MTPHVSTVWDVTQDGRTVLRGSFANYVDADAVRISRYALGDQVSRECRWDDATSTFSRDCEYRGGASKATFGLPCGPQGYWPDGTPCQQELELPRMWEYTFGFERELVPGISLGGDLVYRQFTRPYELRETNRIWNGGGLGAGHGRAATATAAPSRSRTSRRPRAPAAATRASPRWCASARGASRSRWATPGASSTATSTTAGTTTSTATSPGRDVYLWGPLQDDHRHDIRGSFVYSLTNWLSFGSTYSYTSGAPYSRIYRNQTTGRPEDLRARVGVDPGTNINDPTDDRELRLPDIQRLNLRLAANLKPVLGQNLELSLDFLNVLNLRTTTAVITDNGPTSAPRTLLAPRSCGWVRYRYYQRMKTWASPLNDRPMTCFRPGVGRCASSTGLSSTWPAWSPCLDGPCERPARAATSGPVLADQAVQVGAVDAGGLGGGGDVVAVGVEQGLDVLLLHLAHAAVAHLAQGQARATRWAAGGAWGAARAAADEGADSASLLAQGGEAIDEVAQLAHVAQPGARLQLGDQRGRQQGARLRAAGSARPAAVMSETRSRSGGIVTGSTARRK